MPRETIPDFDTKGLGIQVRWRRHDEIPGSTAPGDAQIATLNDWSLSTVHDQFKSIRELLVELAEHPDYQELPLAGRVLDASKDAVCYFDLLTSTYVSLRPDTIRRLVKTLHKANRQAWTEEERARLTAEAAGLVG
jgi:hypothetical protein